MEITFMLASGTSAVTRNIADLNGPDDLAAGFAEARRLDAAADSAELPSNSVLIVRTDGSVQAAAVPDYAASTLAALIGASSVECAPVAAGVGFDVLVDENGYSNDSAAANSTATRLVARWGYLWDLFGDVVIVGSQGANWCDLDATTVQRLAKFGIAEGA